MSSYHQSSGLPVPTGRGGALFTEEGDGAFPAAKEYVTRPQALPWTETRSTVLPALRSAYALPARTGTKSDEPTSHAGGGCSVESPGWMMPAQEESRRTATPPPSSGRAITALALPMAK